MSRLSFWLLRLVLLLFRKEAVRLNLDVRAKGNLAAFAEWIKREGDMAKIGDTFVARIAPTNAAGAPAQVFGASYQEDGDSYDITPAPDGLSAVLVARSSGTNNAVNVTATTKSGAELYESLDLPDVEPNVDEEATKLNLSLEATGTVS